MSWSISVAFIDVNALTALPFITLFTIADEATTDDVDTDSEFATVNSFIDALVNIYALTIDNFITCIANEVT